VIPIEELVLRGITTLFLEEWFMFGFDQQRRPISGLYRDMMGRWVYWLLGTSVHKNRRCVPRKSKASEYLLNEYAGR